MTNKNAIFHAVINASIPKSDAIGSQVTHRFNQCRPTNSVNRCNLGSCWASFFTFAALMVSAVAQAANHSISLYNAIIVMYLCYLYVFSGLQIFVPSVIDRKLQSRTVTRLASFDIGFGLAWMAAGLPWYFWHIFAFYLWVHAKTFGSQPECNAATRLIVLGREFSATGSGRVVSLGE